MPGPVLYLYKFYIFKNISKQPEMKVGIMNSLGLQGFLSFFNKFWE